MTDAELVRAVAERVMGWRREEKMIHDIECFLEDEDCLILSEALRKWLDRHDCCWNPLADWNDCWMVAEKAGLLMLERDDRESQEWNATCREDADMVVSDPDPRRAILLAALASVTTTEPGRAPGERGA